MAPHDCPDFELPGRDLPLLAWATDDQGKDFWVNPSWQATVGAPVVEILEKSRFSWIHPADRSMAKQRFDQACLNHAPLRFRYRLLMATGEYAWMEDHGHARYDEENRYIGHIGVCVDVSKQVALEQRLRQRDEVLLQLHEISEREKSLLSYAIHDGLLQDIIGADMLLQGVDSLTPDRLSTRVAEVRDNLRKALGHGRRLISELRPMILDEQGLVPAVEFFAAEIENRSRMKFVIINRLDCEIKSTMWGGNVFRIAQEAMQNVERHSQADRAHVELTRIGNQLRVVISDQGIGFDLGAQRDGFGLKIMRERAEIYQGTLTVTSEPGHGTTVTLEIPVPTVPKPTAGC